MVRRGPRSGQATVEFALVLPLLVALCLGMIAAAWLLFSYEGVVDAARSAAREALVETSLVMTTASGTCESGLPMPIEAAAQRGATAVPVNPAPLCQSTTDPGELVQTPAASGAADVSVSCSPGLAAGLCEELTASVAYTLSPPFPIPGPIVLTAQSTIAGPDA